MDDYEDDYRYDNLSRISTEKLDEDDGTFTCFEKDNADDFWDDFDFAVKLGDQVRERDKLQAAVKLAVDKPRLCPSVPASSPTCLATNTPSVSQTIVNMEKHFTESQTTEYANTEALFQGLSIAENAEGTGHKSWLANASLMAEQDLSESHSKESGYSSTLTLSQDISTVNCFGSEETEPFQRKTANKELTLSNAGIQSRLNTYGDNLDQVCRISSSFNNYQQFYPEGQITSFNELEPNSPSVRSMMQDKGQNQRIVTSSHSRYSSTYWKTERSLQDESMSSLGGYIPLFDSSKPLLFSTGVNSNFLSPTSLQEHVQLQYSTESGCVADVYDQPRKTLRDTTKWTTPYQQIISDRRPTEMGGLANASTELSGHEQNIVSPSRHQDRSGMPSIRSNCEFTMQRDFDTTKTPGSCMDERLITKPQTYKSSSASLPRISETTYSTSESMTTHSPDNGQSNGVDWFPDQCPTENDLLAEIKENSVVSSIEHGSTVTLTRSLSGSTCHLPVLSTEELSEILSTRHSYDNDIPNQTEIQIKSIDRKKTSLANNSRKMELFDCEVETAGVPRHSVIWNSQTVKSRLLDQVTVGSDSGSSITFSKSTGRAMSKASFHLGVTGPVISRKVQSRMIEVLPAPTSGAPSDNSPAMGTNRLRNGIGPKERIIQGLRRLKTQAQSVLQTIISCTR